VDTTGVAPGTLNANVTVRDDRGLSANCSSAVTVEAPPPPPQASLATVLNFKHNSARVDNVAKAALDDVALRLQQDPNAHAVIVGFSGPEEGPRTRNQASKEAAITRLAEERAINAKAYLVQEKGVSADRIEVRENHTDGGQKAEVWVVPQGASYTGSATQFDENAVKPATPVRHRRVRRHTTHKG
jgi:outer membrane protein OmpA-like peptidoglycan-associated protein